MSIQGWTDPLFPAVQTLQMWRELKAVDPTYPIAMAFADIGHSNAQNPPSQWQPLNSLANGFANAYVLGKWREKPSAPVYSFRTACPPANGTEAAESGTWAGLRKGKVVASASGAWTTMSADVNAKDGADTDPIVHGGCLSEPAGDEDPAGVYLRAVVPPNGFTLLGLPSVSLRYTLLGQDATVVVKAWDAAPDGTRTLVTRGEYRVATLVGHPATGTLTTELYGNEWRFPPGHTLEVQTSQADPPYLRPDNFASTISYFGVRVTFPIHEPLSLSLPLH